jgi:hypothetical protein
MYLQILLITRIWELFRVHHWYRLITASMELDYGPFDLVLHLDKPGQIAEFICKTVLRAWYPKPELQNNI